MRQLRTHRRRHNDRLQHIAVRLRTERRRNLATPLRAGRLHEQRIHQRQRVLLRHRLVGVLQQRQNGIERDLLLDERNALRPGAAVHDILQIGEGRLHRFGGHRFGEHEARIFHAVQIALDEGRAQAVPQHDTVLHQFDERQQHELEQLTGAASIVLDHADNQIEALLIDELGGKRRIGTERDQLLQGDHFIGGLIAGGAENLQEIGGRLSRRMAQLQNGAVLHFAAILLGHIVLVVGLVELEGVVVVVGDRPIVAQLLDDSWIGGEL